LLKIRLNNFPNKQYLENQLIKEIKKFKFVLAITPRRAITPAGG